MDSSFKQKSLGSHLIDAKFAVYQVGGSVRDLLLGIKPHDFDYVVVGATASDLLKQGFIPVGKHFPVFLHPKTHEEYALARREQKIAIGHGGFAFDTTATVSLIDDLRRRDLTINAMALDHNHDLIDPFNGKKDLEQKILRHVSVAFSEDPLRVFRVARFSAKLNFTVSPETLGLMQKIVTSGEITTISKERIQEELTKALNTKYPHRFFQTLAKIDALKYISNTLALIYLDNDKTSKFENSLSKAITAKHGPEQIFALIYYLANENLKLEAQSPEELKNSISVDRDELILLAPNKLAARLSRKLILYILLIKKFDNFTIAQIAQMLTYLDPWRHNADFWQLQEILLNDNAFDDYSNLIAQKQPIIATIINKIKHLNYNQWQLLDHHQKVTQIHQAKLAVIEEALQPQN